MNALLEEQMPITEPVHCSYGPCRCVVPTADTYCSEYCRQAAAQGIDKNYCQCEHKEEGAAAFSTAA